MKKLQQEIKKNGYTYRQHERTKNYAIYRQYDSEGRHVAYEVFRIKKRKGSTRTINGEKRVFDAYEQFPVNEQFGISAWTYRVGQEELMRERCNTIDENCRKRGNASTKNKR